jgi:hypothetical protein
MVMAMKLVEIAQEEVYVTMRRECVLASVGSVALLVNT